MKYQIKVVHFLRRKYAGTCVITIKSATFTLGKSNEIIFQNCLLLLARYDDSALVFGNVCVLLSSCPEKDSSCSSCHSAPVPCSQQIQTATTTTTTTTTTSTTTTTTTTKPTTTTTTTSANSLGDFKILNKYNTSSIDTKLRLTMLCNNW